MVGRRSRPSREHTESPGSRLCEPGFGGRDWATREQGPEAREPQGASGSEGTSLTAGAQDCLGNQAERQVWAGAGKVSVNMLRSLNVAMPFTKQREKLVRASEREW